jgi:hypothetical protein
VTSFIGATRRANASGDNFSYPGALECSLQEKINKIRARWREVADPTWVGQI